MKRGISRKPPLGAPESTVWFGGPVDRFRITLRIRGKNLDPDDMSALLRCAPTKAERKGVPVPTSAGTRVTKEGRWSLTTDSKQCGEDADVEDGVKMLLARLPADPELWASLTAAYAVDILCGLFLASANRGFGISPEVSKLLADRGIEIGFDVYFEPPTMKS